MPISTPPTSIIRSLLAGSVIATLLLFPLINGLSSLPIWLHWTVLDSLETFSSACLVAVLVAVTIWLPARAGRPRLRDAISAAWLVAGCVFTAAAIFKISPILHYLAAYRSMGGWGIGAVVITLAVLAVFTVLRPGQHERTRVERAMQAMWPLTLLLIFHLCRAPMLAASQERSMLSSWSAAPAATPQATPVRSRRQPTRTIVLLFDELSVDYLFGDRAANLSSLPALARLRRDATLYMDAHLKGGATELAIPALLGPTPAAPQGLVNALKSRGSSVRFWGWYHDYCHTFAQGADVCRSTSIYNARTLNESFSLIDPWWTDLNLLPAERPYAVLKRPPAVAFHRRTLDAARQWLATQLADPHSDFVYAHLNVPHLPTLNGQARPFAMDEAGYLSQFVFVDQVVGQAMADTTRQSQLIVLSDHNARPLFPTSQHDRVVFARYRVGVPGSRITQHEDAAGLLSTMSLQDDTH
jgi:hypothetical protein